MASQDRRIQENRYRQEEWADENRREFSPREASRGEDSRRYQSERQDLQGSAADYGRGRDLNYQEDYGRGGEPYGRREQFSRSPFQDDYSDRNRENFERDYYSRRGLQSYEPPRGYLQSNWNRGQDRDLSIARRAAESDDFEREGFYRTPRFERQQRPLSERSFEGAHWLEDEHRARRDENDFGRGEYRNFQGLGPKNYVRSNERIRDDISDRLTDDPYVDASEIEVQVQNGEVSLNGSVENRNQRHRAELIAEQVSGVIHLQNNLRVLHQHAQHQQGHSTDEPNKDKAAVAARPASAAQK